MGVEADLYRFCKMAYVDTYILSPDGKQIQIIHRTSCEQIPMAFNEAKGKLFCGIGNILRAYELGQKKLLRKYDNRNFKSTIVRIQCEDEKVYVADAQESVKVLKFKPEMGQLYIFADDVLNRWVTNFCLLDEDTMAGVDKFENFFVNRLPPGCEDDAEDDPNASKMMWESGHLNGAQYKLDKVNQFFVGEVGTGIQKCKLSQASNEVILFSTTMGGLGVFMPFQTR
mmetsp:Transcript_5527/g.9418  ORF Transcript_5527/g.9418 Transcript_5527/m.9418 type:complete len:227 (-) Transcript_5527:264-944(-)